MDAFLETAGVQLLLFVVCAYYGIRLILTGDASSIRSNKAKPLKDEKQYAKWAGILIIILGVGSLLMALLSLISVYLAFAELVICIAVVFILWKKMSEKYGE